MIIPTHGPGLIKQFLYFELFSKISDVVTWKRKRAVYLTCLLDLSSASQYVMQVDTNRRGDNDNHKLHDFHCS